MGLYEDDGEFIDDIISYCFNWSLTISEGV